MNRLKNTGSSLFLIELMISILFFSLGSAVCVQAFAKAHMASHTAEQLSFASSAVSSAASLVKYTPKSLPALQEYYPNIVLSGKEFLVFYDDDHRECAEKDRIYTLHIRTAQKDSVETAHIFMIFDESEETLFELKLHYPAFSENHETAAKEGT